MAAEFQRGPKPVVAAAGIGLLCLIWGSTWFVVRAGLDDLPPLTSAGVRFALAGAIMVLIAPFIRAREGGGAPTGSLTWVQALGSFAVPYGLVYWSETVLPSGLVSVLWAVFPMMVAMLGHVWLREERLRGVQWIGVTLGLVGVAALFRTDLAKMGPEAVPAAALLLLSPLACAVAQLFVKRGGRDVSSALLNRNGMCLGAVVLLVGAALFERDEPARWTPRAWASIAYLTVVGTVVTFSLYFWLLRYVTANRMSLIAYVTPAIALTIGCGIGEEPLTWTLAGGTALILGGVVLVVRGKARETSAPARPPAEEQAGAGS